MPVLDCLRLFLINAVSAEAKDKVHNEQNFLPSAKSYVSCLNTVQQHCVIRGAALLLRVVFCLRFTPLSHRTQHDLETSSNSILLLLVLLQHHQSLDSGESCPMPVHLGMHSVGFLPICRHLPARSGWLQIYACRCRFFFQLITENIKSLLWWN